MTMTYDSPEDAMQQQEKIKYWWSEDRQWFCVRINDGTGHATVSLTVEEAEALMDEVMQTPRFLEFQKECLERARQLMDERASAHSSQHQPPHHQQEK